MTKTLAWTLALAALLAGCATPADPPAPSPTPTAASSPYAGEESRDIKALSAQEVADLLAGKGMGYAKAAELNSWPGPAHVLELADALALTDAQRHGIERVRAAMQEDAERLGRALVDAEARLDEAFASRDVDAARLGMLVDEAATIEGNLRAVHLRAHLETTDLLTQHQVARYDELRGYSGGDGDADGGHDGGHGH